MSGENLVKFLLGTLDRVRDRALGMLGSGSPVGGGQYSGGPMDAP